MPEDKVEEARGYIETKTPRSIVAGSDCYYKKLNTIIVSYAGDWPLDDQYSISNYVRQRYQVEVDFQEI